MESRRRGTELRRWLPGVVLCLASCAPSPADLNIGVVEFAPLPVYRDWWRQVESCSGITGDIARVEWLLAEDFAGPDGDTVLGQWSPPHSITFRRGYEVIVGVVKHEILHDLLRGDEFHDDPSWFWCRLPVG